MKSSTAAKKSALGQFMTTNYEYILQNLAVPPQVDIIEPFAGNGDLLNILTHDQRARAECYDIDPKHSFVVRRDTLLDPPDYSNKFILTNPPYLARNKSTEKRAFDKYNTNDLYKCFILQLIAAATAPEPPPVGGILIVPLNFWSSIRAADIELRRQFLEIYHICHINIFEEQVFEDTTYTTCAFAFEYYGGATPRDAAPVSITLYPAGENIHVRFCDRNNYMIGGEIYNLAPPRRRAGRLTHKNCAAALDAGTMTHIVVKCIDDTAPIAFLWEENGAETRIDNTPNTSARTYMSLTVAAPAISRDEQRELMEKCNLFLSNYRKKYHSLFLCNYRENNRKRISFELVYNIVDTVLAEGEM
jgi:hypothetical protein